LKAAAQLEVTTCSFKYCHSS